MNVNKKINIKFILIVWIVNLLCKFFKLLFFLFKRLMLFCRLKMIFINNFFNWYRILLMVLLFVILMVVSNVLIYLESVICFRFVFR